MLLLSYLLTLFLDHHKLHWIYGVTVIFPSQNRFLSSMALMDIYTPLGLLALYLILKSMENKKLHIILGLSFCAHYEKTFLLPLTAVIYTLATKIDAKILRQSFTVFLVSIVLIGGLHMALINKPKPTSDAPYYHLTKPLFENYPTETIGYFENNPDSKLTGLKNIYIDYNYENTGTPTNLFLFTIHRKGF